MESLQRSVGVDWLLVGEPLLFFGSGALFFDVPSHEFSRLASDPRQVASISQALKTAGTIANRSLDGPKRKCSLTGKDEQLIEDTFPELVIPVIGKTILFSRFNAIPSNARYGNFGAKSFSVSQNIAETLAAVLRFLTSRDRESVTWKSIPGEAPKQSDLLLAFVDEALDVPTAALVAENDEDDDFPEEESNSVKDPINSIAVFEKRTFKRRDFTNPF